MTDSPACRLPDREDERLAAVTACVILDTAPDPRFDALVALAASYFETPMAMVSLIDRTRQWYKASIGMDVRETPRALTFCAYALLKPEEILVVEDATQDPRFADHPSVTGPASIRFYASAPIRVERGEAVGTVCVVDTRPREMSAKDREFLAKLAISASALLDLHRKTLVLRDLAERDALTGLPNRRALEVDLARAIASARQGRPCGVLYIDVDHFKAINDTHGHEIGDAFLCAISRRLEASVRKLDRVARLGGDEFVVLLSNDINEPALGVVGRRILEACAAPLTIQGVSMAAQVSIGGALAPRHAAEAKTLLKAADEALYDAKRSGRGRLVVAKPGRKVSVKGAGLEDDLRRAIAEDALHLVWQPCVKLADGAVSGYEALARWTHPQFGPISPDVFVPLAENGGMSRDFDAWVLRRACQAALEGPRGVRIGVNMSAFSLCEADVAATLVAVLGETGLPPERIVLEITERTLINDPESALEAMTRLNAMGVSFALDDFGAGYAALSYLSKYPFRVLKLDRSLIADIGEESRALTVVAGIVEIGRQLGMTVVAEGVETEIQAALLVAAGCEMAQGYLFARPGPLPKREAAAAA